MWAKRFPVPEFDRHALKDLDWETPQIADQLNEESYGAAALAADPAICDKFHFQGEHVLIVACTLPDQPVRVSGNSFAWPIQRVVMFDSLNADECNVVADWKTPRPMNTRFGPDGGITVTAGKLYILIGHQFADHWVGSRVMLDNEWSGDCESGFRILSSCEAEINDFHDAVVYFEWDKS
ncbi:MAG: hypothetical protein OXI60_09980 [Acidiferrobacterales bacterium]|nr:hypothetical protein [Acidiferrobacterales bacterium]